MTDARDALDAYEVECLSWNEDHAVWTAEAPKAFAALRAVLNLHSPVSQNRFAATPLANPVDVCRHDNTLIYPCPTVHAIQTALGDTTP